MPHPPRRLLATLLLACAAAAPASAQTLGGDDISRRLDQVRRETRLLASPDLAAGDRALIDYGGFLTLSYFSTDSSNGDNRALRQYDLNLYARLNFDGAHEFYFRNRLQYRDYNPGDETATDDDGLQSFFEEAYYRFDLARYLAAYRGQSTTDNLTLTVGRQFEEWATGLVLSQYVDGAKADVKLGDFEAKLLAAVTQYGTTDFDASRPDFDKSTYRGFFGSQVAYRVGGHKPFAYALVQRDFNKDRTLDVGPVRTEFEYNSWYLGLGSTGSLTDNWRYALEAIYEGGEGLSSPLDAAGNPTTQEKETISAWAGQATLDYYFNDPYRSRAGVAFLAASGDDDRSVTNDTFAGNTPGTSDNAFNALGIVSYGYAFSPPASNLLALKAGASTYPLTRFGAELSRLQLGGDVIFFGKTNTDAPIDEFTFNGDRYLGTELGTYANWRIVEDITLQLRYGIFFPGEALPSSHARQFLYASFTYSF